MRRIGRWIFNGLTLLSLVLCVSSVIAWIASYQRWDQLSWRHAASAEWVQTQRGYLVVCGMVMTPWPSGPHDPLGLRHRHDEPMGPFNGLLMLNIEPGDQITDWQWHGFTWYSIRSTIGPRLQFNALIPFWAVVAGMALLPAVWLIQRQRLRRRLRQAEQQSLCQACGYDLRATPDRCPECGRAVVRI